jgi:hypothetical protein
MASAHRGLTVLFSVVFATSTFLRPATATSVFAAIFAEDTSMIGQIKHIKRAGLFCFGVCVGATLMAAQANAAPPIPIHFAPGSYGAVANGRVTATEFLQTFKLDVAAGQVMILTFAGPGPMRGEVQCQGGVGGGPYYGGGDTITLTTAGECDITVGANTMADPVWSGEFTIAVLVFTPPKTP